MSLYFAVLTRTNMFKKTDVTYVEAGDSKQMSITPNLKSRVSPTVPTFCALASPKIHVVVIPIVTAGLPTES